MNGASSDSKVFVKLYGEKGDTNKMILAVSDNDLRNYFETGQTDIFTIETFDIGQASLSNVCSPHKDLSLGSDICSCFLILFYNICVCRSVVCWLVTLMRVCGLDGFWTVCRFLYLCMGRSTCSQATAGSAKMRLMGKWRLRSIPVRSWTLKNVNQKQLNKYFTVRICHCKQRNCEFE